MATKEEETKAAGYSLELFQENIPDKYLCTLCGLVAENIQVINCCEKRFCLSCIKPFQDKHQPCPDCQDEEFDLMLMKKDNATIKDMKVCCREKKRGCQWMGKLRELQYHLLKEEDGCQYSPRVCPKCQKLINRCDMFDHRENLCPEREYQCKYCNYGGSYDNVMRAHMPECSYCPLKCPNHCGVTCERANMDEHIHKICPEQYLLCEYEYAGCEDKYRRKNQEDHMSRFVNDHKMMVHVHKMVTRMTKKHEEENGAYKKEIHELRNKVDQLEEEVKQMRLKHHHGNQHDLECNSNQYAHGEEDLICRVGEKSSNSLPRSLTGNVYVLQVNRTWMMTVDRFTERKDHQTMWESDVRQTGFGFKLQLNVWPNGKERGEGTHMTVWLGYIVGDDDQRPPTPTTITMTLELDDCYGQRKLIKTENFRIGHVGRYRFNYIGTFNDNQLISHERLNKQNFIRNDSIVMSITLIEERILSYSEVTAEDSLDTYFDSQLEGNFIKPYSPQVD